ncbi:MAG TPA: VWA domain-containing protein, partial [Blastocatellia bacterium]|nr:VWA domain-containing protein [Blastocatellia bacterium]
MKKFLAVVLAAFGSAAFIYGCGGAGKTAPAHTFRIISGSENKSLEPLIQDFAKHNGIAITMDYKGSVDIMTGLSSDDFPYDAVWPAQSLWVKLGD